MSTTHGGVYGRGGETMRKSSNGVLGTDPGVSQRIVRWRGQHGVARSVPVFGPGRPADDVLVGMLQACPELRLAAAEAGVELDDSVESLEELDRLVDLWLDTRPATAYELASEVGYHLGTVMVRTIPDSDWMVWSNGHPAVRVGEELELDLVRLGNERVARTGPSLMQMYRNSHPDLAPLQVDDGPGAEPDPYERYDDPEPDPDDPFAPYVARMRERH
ncbi:DUF6278 family protein [Allostreptomyces psammosilenae]|uniref:Uncharacterized protein n=1 Tax=Allostreptomyces psammosilenae TaxID=1892865 RepID=A0A852ZWC4_9ACTN|nr:DUF6278 family protein [Allostreptomyces psammosilenae]NYI06255.1 hypothetical protein [Allostreptomyces psammosilenae]